MRHRYSVQFKRRMVAAVREGIRVSKIARDFGVSANSIYGWLKRYRRSKKTKPPACYQVPATGFISGPVVATASAGNVLQIGLDLNPKRPSKEEVAQAVIGAFEAMERVIKVISARGK